MFLKILGLLKCSGSLRGLMKYDDERKRRWLLAVSKSVIEALLRGTGRGSVRDRLGHESSGASGDIRYLHVLVLSE